jgi:hypothetical protein
MASLAYLLQISFCYTFCGYLKSHPQWTTQGTAIGIALSGDQFIKPFGQNLLQYPALLKFLTFAVLNLERWGALFFFFPFKTTYVRFLTIIIFMSFHAGLLLSMELGLFQWVCLVMLIGFIPTPFLNTITGSFKSGLKQTTPVYLNILIVFLIVYVFLWNVGELKNSKLGIPASLKSIGYALNINQRWSMYAPIPFGDDGWFVIPGQLRNGQEADILNSTDTISWQEPKSLPEYNKNYRLGLYYYRIHRPKYSFYVLPWAQYLCSQWNGKHPPEEQLVSLDIVFMQRDLVADFKRPTPYKVPIFSYNCS